MRLGALKSNEEFVLDGVEYVAGHAYGCESGYAWVISREDGLKRMMSLDTEVEKKEKKYGKGL